MKSKPDVHKKNIDYLRGSLFINVQFVMKRISTNHEYKSKILQTSITPL